MTRVRPDLDPTIRVTRAKHIVRRLRAAVDRFEGRPPTPEEWDQVRDLLKRPSELPLGERLEVWDDGSLVVVAIDGSRRTVG